MLYQPEQLGLLCRIVPVSDECYCWVMHCISEVLNARGVPPPELQEVVSKVEFVVVFTFGEHVRMRRPLVVKRHAILICDVALAGPGQ